MKYFVIIVFVLVSTFSFCQYTLQQPSMTSAGVFKQDGTLIRTLWSGVQKAAGSYPKPTWDGKDDIGGTATAGNYIIRVRSNNITYTWEGVAGNTSANITGRDILHGQRIIYAVCASGNRLYVSQNYGEKVAATQYIDLNDKNKFKHLFNNEEGAWVRYVATDGINVYWGGGDNNKGMSFIFATKVSDNTEAVGTNSVAYKTTFGRQYISSFAIAGVQSNADIDQTYQITGMGVQKSSNKLVFTRQLQNSIYVYDKTTYAMIKTITNIAKPREVAVDTLGNVWMVHDSVTVEKYKVNSDGSLSSTGIKLAGLSDPYALAVSPTTNEIVVCDAGNSQQIKFYSATGSLNNTMGVAGGYVNSPDVTDYKFMFSKATGERFTTAHNHGNNYASITFEPNGSFWVTDLHNSRVQHYTNAKVFSDRMMMLQNNRQSVDINNVKRVLRGQLEFDIDYNNPNYRTSWTLTKNWNGNMSAGYGSIEDVTTMSNGKTYAWQPFNQNQSRELVELSATGLRYTGIRKTGLNWSIDQKDNLITWNNAGVGSTQTFTKYARTGFTTNNPIWSSSGVIFAKASPTGDDPRQEFHNKYRATSSGVVGIFHQYKGVTGYHFGGITSAGYKFKTSKSTSSSYTGPYPLDGTFDIGNGVGNAGSISSAAGKTLLWSYIGEFWKGGFQCNQHAHYYEDGLLLKVFGTNWMQNPNNPYSQDPGGGVFTPFAGMAGNANDPQMIVSPLDSNTLYLYHNDESWHSGIHRWKISGLNTIKEFNMPVSKASRPIREVITLSPNPTRNKINLSKEVLNASLYSVNGTLIKNYTKTKSFDVSFLADGIYILKADEKIYKFVISNN